MFVFFLFDWECCLLFLCTVYGLFVISDGFWFCDVVSYVLQDFLGSFEVFWFEAVLRISSFFSCFR